MVFLVTHETQESLFPYFIYKVKYVDNWGTVFLSNALMFIKCPGVSISINDNRNASATFLRAVGNLILNNEICSLPVRIDCAAMKPEWWLFFSWMENTFILLYSIQSSEWRHTGSCALAVFLLVLFFLECPVGDSPKERGVIIEWPLCYFMTHTTNLESFWLVIPWRCPTQCFSIDTTRNVNTLCQLINILRAEMK